MPLYEYQCQSCAHRFELIRRYADPPVEACPACGGSVRKLLSSPAIQFKGSGWYITDYARKGADSGKTESPTGDAAKTGSTSTDAPKSASSSDQASSSSTTAAPPSPAKDS